MNGYDSDYKVLLQLEHPQCYSWLGWPPYQGFPSLGLHLCCDLFSDRWGGRGDCHQQSRCSRSSSSPCWWSSSLWRCWPSWKCWPWPRRYCRCRHPQKPGKGRFSNWRWINTWCWLNYWTTTIVHNTQLALWNCSTPQMTKKAIYCFRGVSLSSLHFKYW